MIKSLHFLHHGIGLVAVYSQRQRQGVLQREAAQILKDRFSVSTVFEVCQQLLAEYNDEQFR